MVSWLLLPLLMGGEYILFVVLSLADDYLTNAAVAKYGVEIESNSRVRDMYNTRDFRQSRRGKVVITAFYFGLIAASFQLSFSYQFQFWAVVLGLAFLMFPLGNLIVSAFAYHRLRTRAGGEPVTVSS